MCEEDNKLVKRKQMGTGKGLMFYMKPKIVIVAGGLAERMRPVTECLPKCLVNLNGKPLMQHQIEFFKSRGYEDFIFCVAHLSEKVKEYFGDGSSFGVRIEYSEEGKHLLGTAGAVKLIKPKVKDTVIVYYGDVLTKENLDNVLGFHRKVGSDFTVVMRELTKGRASSMITMDSENKIKVFIERPSPGDFEKFKGEKKYVNSGIYVMEPGVFREIPERERCDFGRDVIPRLIGKKMKVYGYVSRKFFREMGRFEKYKRFKKEIAKGRVME